MPLIMTLDGEKAVLEQGLTAFAKQNGWDESSEKTLLDFSRDILASYIKESVKAYNANKAAVLAAEAAKAQTEAVFGSSILSVELKD